MISVFHCYYWIDLDKWEKLSYDSEVEPAMKTAYEWLDSCNVMIFANMAVLLLTLGINQKIEVDREMRARGEPAFFKWVPKNAEKKLKNAQVTHAKD